MYDIIKAMLKPPWWVSYVAMHVSWSYVFKMPYLWDAKEIMNIAGMLVECKVWMSSHDYH